MEKIEYNFNLSKKIYNYFSNIYKGVESRVLYKNSYFLDSNFLIQKHDNRYKIFRNKTKKFLVTEYISNEISGKENNWKNLIDPNNLKTINFDDLRSIFPATCPVYYNFIKSIHNPANICSNDFLINKNFAVKERGKLNEDRKELNQILISRFYKGHKKKLINWANKKKNGKTI